MDKFAMDEIAMGKGSAGSLRMRWSAVGAAVAITLGAGGVGLVQAVVDSGPKSVTVTVDAKRIVDTRIGLGIAGRFTPDAPRDVQVTGSVDVATAGGTANELVVPSGATSALVNVTVVSPTDVGFLTLRTGGVVAKPTTSTVNFTAGSIEPNAATVDLTDDGRLQVWVSMPTPSATADVLIDVVGYTIDHHHDDRYYTKAEVDSAVAAASAAADAALGAAVAPKADSTAVAADIASAVAPKADAADVYSRTEVDAAIAVVDAAAGGVDHASSTATTPLAASTPLALTTLTVSIPEAGHLIIDAKVGLTTGGGAVVDCWTTLGAGILARPAGDTFGVGIVGGGASTLTSVWSDTSGIAVAAGDAVLNLVCERGAFGSATAAGARLTATYSTTRLD